MQSTPKNSDEISILAPSDRLLMTLIRLGFLAYFVYLTLLLLTPDPFRLVFGGTKVNHLLVQMYSIAHFICFTILTVFALLACRPWSVWITASLLVAYASGTELLQKLIPPRTAEWQDWFQDLGGIVFGIGIIWVLATVWNAWRGSQEEVCSEIAS
jgi:VanZ family protein